MRSLLFIGLMALAPSSPLAAQNQAGLLVMAHGGDEDWDAAVKEAVRPLAEKYPVAIAFGMANPKTLRTAVSDLLRQGATSINVVRLFASASSFLQETEYALGVRPTKPSGHFMHKPEVLNVGRPVSINGDGLLDAEELGSVLADRSIGLSKDPNLETVLILGHGPASDVENQEWLEKMDHLADAVRDRAPFHSVIVSTLREDWTGKRQSVELELRELIRTETLLGRSVLVIPFRLFGFGPYAEVFEDLSYRSDGVGLLPDERVTHWIEKQFLSMLAREESDEVNSTGLQ